MKNVVEHSGTDLKKEDQLMRAPLTVGVKSLGVATTNRKINWKTLGGLAASWEFSISAGCK